MASSGQPLDSRFDLASSPSAVRWGRKHTTEVLTAWGVAEAVTHDALLIVSELLSNAVQHAAKPFEDSDDRPDVMACSLRLRLTETGLTVSVYDADRRPPALRDAPTDAERGRGLHLVDALSEAWGHTYPSTTSGKRVWARLSLRERPIGDSRHRSHSAARTEGTGASAVMSA